MKQSKQEIYEKIKEYFNGNTDVFNRCIEELDNWNGYLGDDRYYYMEELDELYADTKPTELLDRVYYGHDKENGSESEFCPNRDYFRYNGYGNLVSADFKDYSDHLDDEFINELVDNRNNIDIIDDVEELKELFDMLETGESEDDEE